MSDVNTWPPSAHALRRQGLEVVADTAALAARLESRGLIENRAGWDRHFGRFHPDRDIWATVVLREPESGSLLHLQVSDTAVASGNHTRLLPLTDGSGAAVSAFPFDPGLPTLGQALEPLDAVCVVRYRPARRCTLSATQDGVGRFVKVTADAAAIHRDSCTLWAASEKARFDFDVAEPLGCDEAVQAVHQGIVLGEPLAPFVFGPDGVAWSRRLGEALASLAVSPIMATHTADHREQLCRSERAARRVEVRVPALAPRIRAVMHQLDTLHAALRPQDPVPVHGAPHVHQWLLDGDRLGLVDFDRAAMGEPELDIATFLAELDSEGELTVSVDSLEAAIVQGFESVAGPLDHQRLWLYRVHKRLAKVSRTTMALRVDGDVRAERHLRRVEELLAGPSA